jgi:hypothetical protein
MKDDIIIDPRYEGRYDTAFRFRTIHLPPNTACDLCRWHTIHLSRTLNRGNPVDSLGSKQLSLRDILIRPFRIIHHPSLNDAFGKLSPVRKSVVPQSGQKWDVIFLPVSAVLEIVLGVPKLCKIRKAEVGRSVIGIPDSSLKLVSGTTRLLL